MTKFDHTNIEICTHPVASNRRVHFRKKKKKNRHMISENVILILFIFLNPLWMIFVAWCAKARGFYQLRRLLKSLSEKVVSIITESHWLNHIQLKHKDYISTHKLQKSTILRISKTKSFVATRKCMKDWASIYEGKHPTATRCTQSPEEEETADQIENGFM